MEIASTTFALHNVALMPEPAAPVVVALLVTDPGRIPDALDAIAAQTTPVRATYVVGDGDDDGPAGDGRVGGVLDVVEKADRDVSHVWLLHDDAVPRPDALGALLRESQRTDASVAGSKLLDSRDHDRLESVGGATDVVGFPYTGLQPDEIDQEQYDVVRDVAFAPGASMLVRRDLLRGLRGPDSLLEPGAAEIDFSQRARLSGGRVIVVPSSEVMHTGSCRAEVPAWRKTAGRYRAVAKAYRLMTLLWVLPLALVLGLVEAVVRTFAGRPLAVVDEIRAWIWNVIHLPSLISERRSVQRLLGDEELFRYQVGGSASLRVLGADLADRSRRRAETSGRPVGDWVARSATMWQTPGFAASIALVVAVLFALRTGFFGDLPTNGFAMPLLLDSREALRSVAGGWNLGGLGSPVPLHPSIIPQALVGFVVSPDTGRLVVLLATATAGAVGAWRLAASLELGAAARFFAALSLIAGPATAAGLADGYPAVLGAAACVPLALATLVRSPRQSRMGRLGSVAGLSIGIGVATWFVPLAPVAIVVVGLVLAGTGVLAWRALGPLVLATALAAVWAAPYLLFISFEALVVGRDAFWEVGIVVGSLLVAGALGGLLTTDEAHARLAAAGGLLIGLGAVASRLAAAGVGLEVWAAGLTIAAVGTMLLAAALVDRNPVENSWGIRTAHALSRLAIVAAVLIAAGPLIWSGSYGLASVDWAEQLAFSGARADGHGPDRILVLGDGLPGEHGVVLGTPYRVLIRPGLEEAWIGPGQPGDTALRTALNDLYADGVVRPGDVLADFGIKWVVVVGDTPFDSTFESVLDMKKLPIPDATIFENLEPSPVVSTSSGVAWSAQGLGFVGPPAGELSALIQYSQGWGPTDGADGWAMTLDGSEGRIGFTPPILIETAAYAAVALALLTVAAWAATRRRP